MNTFQGTTPPVEQLLVFKVYLLQTNSTKHIKA